MAEQNDPQPAGSRSVRLEKIGEHRFKAHNERGGVLPIGDGGDPDFSPVELLLAGLAGCGALDLDYMNGKHAPLETFAALAEGVKIRDEQGNRMIDLKVTFDVSYPEGKGGDTARQRLPKALQMITERLCTVGRTVTVGAPVRYVEGDLG